MPTPKRQKKPAAGTAGNPLPEIPQVPNERAIRRLVGALLLEQNDAYAIQKRYMGVESMSQLSENPTNRLPAAPALA